MLAGPILADLPAVGCHPGFDGVLVPGIHADVGVGRRTRKSGFPVRVKVFDHCSARANGATARHRPKITDAIRLHTLPPTRADTHLPRSQTVIRTFREQGSGAISVDAWCPLAATMHSQRIRHPHQCPLRKRHIEQRRRRRKCCPKSDLVEPGETGRSPTTGRAPEWPGTSAGTFSRSLVIECDRRQQIKAQRNTHTCRDQHGDENDADAPHPGRNALVTRSISAKRKSAAT